MHPNTRSLESSQGQRTNFLNQIHQKIADDSVCNISQKGSQMGEDHFHFCLQCKKVLHSREVMSHIKYHVNIDKNFNLGLIDHTENIKKHEQQRISESIQQLQQKFDDPSFKNLMDQDDYHQESINKIHNHRQIVIDMVIQYFQELEDDIKQFLNFSNKTIQNKNQSQEIHESLQKYQDIIHELNYHYEELEESSSEALNEVLLEVTNINFDRLINKITQELTQLARKNKGEQPQIQSKREILDNLRQLLRQYCNIDKSVSQDSSYKAKNINYQIKDQSQYHQQIQNQNHQQQVQIQQVQINRQKIDEDQIQNTAENIESLDFISQPVQQTTMLKIDHPSYAKHPIFHFFQNDTKKLYTLDLPQFLDKKQHHFKVQTLNISFPIPGFHRSISDEKNHIYLMGGSQQGQKLDTIYQYNESKQTLDFKAHLKIQRSSHSLCYIKPNIYIIGGFTKNQKFISQCEVYNTETNQVSQIGNLNIPTTTPSLSTFQERYIFKFGGKIQNGDLSQLIEKYDSKLDIWHVLNPKIQYQAQQIPDFRLLSNSASIQINEHQVLIFGGYYESNSNSSQCFTFQIDNSKDLTDYDGFLIKDINQFKLPQAEGFWNNDPVVYNGKIYGLQNIQDFDHENSKEDARQLVCFDGKSWKNLL